MPAACSASTGVAPELGDITLDIEVTSPDPESRIEPMLAAWRARCPIFLALLQPNAVSLTDERRPSRRLDWGEWSRSC